MTKYISITGFLSKENGKRFSVEEQNIVISEFLTFVANKQLDFAGTLKPENE